MGVSEVKDMMYDIVGAIHEVHRELGPGLNEYCYQEALEMQFREQGLPYVREQSFHPTYHGKEMEAQYRVDFLCKNCIIIECKAVTELLSAHRSQLFNYMRLTKMPCGILVNFSPKYAEIERYIFEDSMDSIIGMDGKIMKKMK